MKGNETIGKKKPAAKLGVVVGIALILIVVALIAVALATTNVRGPEPSNPNNTAWHRIVAPTDNANALHEWHRTYPATTD